MRLRSQAAAFKGRGFFIAALFLLPFATGPVSAGEVPAGAQLAPVAKVFGNLLAQVRWPDARQTGKPRLCLLGEDSTIAALRQVDGSSGFVIQPLTPVGADFSACDALYLARDPAGGHEALLQELRQQPVLTIGSGVQFLDQGGMISILGPGRAFYINQGAAWSAGLNLGSELYSEAANFAESDA